MDGRPKRELSEGVNRVHDGAEEVGTLLIPPGENRVKRWLLLDGKRWEVAAVLLLSVFGSLVALGIVWPLQMNTLVTETTTVQTLFNTLLSGTVVLVSIVVSINWIVLSQDLTSLGHQLGRIEDSLEFRRSVESVIDAPVSPADPAEFLRTLLETTRSRAADLEESVDGDGETLERTVDEFVTALERQSSRVSDRLDRADGEPMSVLLSGLGYDHSWQMYVVRRLAITHRETLSPDADAAIDDLVDALKFFGTGREYFKTLYYMREFATLSRALLYVSLPTIVFNSYVLLGIDSQLFPEVQVLNLTPLMVFVIAAYTVALAPFVVLTAYVLRPATVAVRTLTAGPFVLQHDETEREVDWRE